MPASSNSAVAKPAASQQPILTVSLIPVVTGQLLAFDVSAPEAQGRWLPWTVLEYGQSPWECASLLGDEWCDGHINAIRLVDAISNFATNGGWELALVFRAELTLIPSAKPDRAPVIVSAGDSSLLNSFAEVDISRWVAGDPPHAPGGSTPASPLFF